MNKRDLIDAARKRIVARGKAKSIKRLGHQDVQTCVCGRAVKGRGPFAKHQLACKDAQASIGHEERTQP